MDAPIKELRPVTEQEAYLITGTFSFYGLMDFLTDKPLSSFEIKYIFIGMLTSRGVYCPEWSETLVLKRLKEAKEKELIYSRNGSYSTRCSVLSK
jgi:hypothetical protein